MADQQPQCVADTLRRILQRQRGYAAIACPDEEQCAVAFGGIEQALKISRFRVLFLGRFGSGKSSLINGLLGFEVEPTKVIPCTGAITEIIFEDKALFTLPPVRSLFGEIWADVISPQYPVSFTGLGVGGQHAPRNQYQHLVARSPSEALRGGTVFVDTPGFSYGSGWDEIMMEWAPRSDVIVYACNSTAAFAQDDISVLQQLRASGNRSVLIACTFGDLVQSSPQDPALEDEFRDYVRKMAAQYAGIGEDSLFFVSARSAIAAEKDGNQALLQQSGIPQMRQRLSWLKERAVARQCLPGMMEINQRLSQALSTRALQLCLQPQPQHSDIAEVDSLKQCVRALEQQLSQIHQQVDQLSEA